MKIKKYIGVLSVIASFALFFTNVEIVKASVFESILFCTKTLIPSIFIFMVLTSIILYTKALEALFEIIPDKAFYVLGVCKKYFLIILTCSLCGFVNGPKALCEDYKENGGNPTELSNAIALSSNAGIGFLIGFVGKQLWGDAVFGLWLFLAQIFWAFFLGKLILKRVDIHSKNSDFYNKNPTNKISFFSSISKAVISSSTTIISICAFVIFFSVICEIAASVCLLKKDSGGYSILNILCEFCKGSIYCIKFENTLLCAFFSGLCVGFGGFCVHFQTFAVCEGFYVDKVRFIAFKTIHGVVCGLSALLYAYIRKSEPVRSVFLSFDNLKLSSFFITIFCLFVGAYLIYLIYKKIFQKLY